MATLDKKILKTIDAIKDKITDVTISGGEPLLFMEEVDELGKVKTPTIQSKTIQFGNDLVEDIVNTPESITGQYLSGFKKIPIPASRRAGTGQKLTVRGAKENNLKDIDVLNVKDNKNKVEEYNKKHGR